MGNVFSEEPDRPEQAQGRRTFDITELRRGKIEGTYAQRRFAREQEEQQEYDRLAEIRRTATHLRDRVAADAAIQKHLLLASKRRNAAQRASTRHRRFGRLNTLRSNTRKYASNAQEYLKTPIDILRFHLQLPKRAGYYKGHRQLFQILSILNELENGCEIIIENGDSPVCNVIKNDKHTELVEAIVGIDERTFHERFPNLVTFYDDCKELYKKRTPSGTSTVASAAVSAIESSASAFTNPVKQVGDSSWFKWFTGLFTRKRHHTSERPNSFTPIPSRLGSRPMTNAEIVGANVLSVPPSGVSPSGVSPSGAPASEQEISLQGPSRGGSRTRKHKRKLLRSR